MSINRIIVDAKIYDAFIEKSLLIAKQISFGDPTRQETLIGPVIIADRVEKHKEIIQKAVADDTQLALKDEI